MHGLLAQPNPVPVLCAVTYGDRPPRPVTVEHNDTPATAGGQEKAMYQLTQLAAGQHRQRTAEAARQRPGQRALALARATRRAERAERRMRRAARHARRLRAQLHAHTATGQ
jgi:hypothetical protein